MSDINPNKDDREYSPRESAQRWTKELAAAKKELSKFHHASATITKKYLDQRGTHDDGEFKVNLFWSNIQVLKASLYAKPPRVDVSNSFKDAEDDVSRVGGNILERMLNHSVEKDNSDFHIAAQQGVGDYLIVGMGQIWYRYEVETEQRSTEPVLDPQTGAVLAEAVEYEAIKHEDCLTDYVFWEDFWFSPCRTWQECRWVAKRVYMGKEQLEERFGEDKAKLVPLSKGKDRRDSGQPQNDPWEKAPVFEIWDKTTKKVYWYVVGMDEVLDEQADPLGLTDFFPCPQPLVSNLTNSNFLPRADYQLVQDQYTQIDELTTRITHLIRACKMVGVYDKNSVAVGRVFQEGLENQMIPTDNWASFSEKGGLKGTMDFVPVDMAAQIIDKLTGQREILKANIFEVLGIGDIMRGMTDPSETLGAQQLKAQFGGSRLQYKQLDIGTWVASGQRIRAEIICKHFQPGTIKERSNIMHSPDASLADQAIQFLKEDATRRYRVTVEAETMAMIDWAQERDARTQFMAAVGDFTQRIAPIVQMAPQTAPMFMQMMKWGLGGFRIGKEIETVLDQAIQSASQPEQPQQPSPQEQAELKKTEAEAFQKQASGQKDLVEAQTMPQRLQVEATNAQAKLMKGQNLLQEPGR